MLLCGKLDVIHMLRLISKRVIRWSIIICLIIGGLIIYIWVHSYIQNMRFEASKHLFSPNDITFEQVSLDRNNPSSFRLSGKIHNHSNRFDLLEAKLRLIIQDCSKPACIKLGETTLGLYTRVPNQEIRSFDQGVYFEGIPALRNRFNFIYEIEYLRGAEGPR